MKKFPLTFIIPLKIDSSDRYKNINFILKYLLHNYDCPIILTEADNLKKLESSPIIKDSRIKYYFEKIDINDPFHRTKYLNKMLSVVETDLVCNYDCDVFFDPKTIESSVEMLRNREVDLVYPFGENEMDQIRVYSQQCDIEEMVSADYHENPQKFLKLLAKNKIKINSYETHCGHCQMFKTESYIRGYMENENFISWAPEDKERLWRFRMLGFNVQHMKGNLVYHLEHTRNQDSSPLNPYMHSNNFLWEKIQKMNKEELISYYENQEYFKFYSRVK